MNTTQSENRMEPARKEVLQECKVQRAEKRAVLKEVASHQSCERHSQKALLFLSARCQQLEEELAAAHTKVCDDDTSIVVYEVHRRLSQVHLGCV